MDNKRPESPEEQQNSQAEEKPNADVASLKKHMTLDLNSGDGNSRKKAKQALLTKGTPGLFSGNLMGSSNLWTPSANVLLESPDLKMLKMASPDLEHFIRTNTNINLTPTPSLANPQLAFEMALECMKAKEQQEQQQHQSPHHSQASLSNNLNLSLSNLNQNLLLNQIISQNTQSKQLEAAVLAEQLQQQQQQSAQNVLSDAELQFKLSQLLARSAAFGSAADLEAISGATASGGQSSLSGVGGAYSDSSRPPSNASSSFYAMNMMNNDSGESSNNTSIASGSRGDAHGASTSGGGGGGSNVSMIDLEDQERLKLERKRMRNRIAASKCRRRKLERISKLEEKVRQLKNENSDLTSIIYKLRENVCHLKEEVLQHMKSGCNINSSLVQT